MSGQNLIRKDHLIFVVVISTLIISSSSISNYGYFDNTKLVYGQLDPDQMNSKSTNPVNIHNISLEKVRVGDIDIAYKIIGKGDPILLISPAQADMNTWDPSLLGTLSTNHR